MATVREAFEFYKKAIRDGKGENHCGHPYIAEDAARAREKNEQDPITGKRKTKIAFDSTDPECYIEWHIERARWMKAANKNPAVSTDAMILALKAYSEEAIDELIQTLGAVRAQAEARKAKEAGIPPAQLGTPF